LLRVPTLALPCALTLRPVTIAHISHPASTRNCFARSVLLVKTLDHFGQLKPLTPISKDTTEDGDAAAAAAAAAGDAVAASDKPAFLAAMQSVTPMDLQELGRRAYFALLISLAIAKSSSIRAVAIGMTLSDYVTRASFLSEEKLAPVLQRLNVPLSLTVSPELKGFSSCIVTAAGTLLGYLAPSSMAALSGSLIGSYAIADVSKRRMEVDQVKISPVRADAAAWGVAVMSFLLQHPFMEGAPGMKLPVILRVLCCFPVVLEKWLLKLGRSSARVLGQ
jgi:hypothetical protein